MPGGKSMSRLRGHLVILASILLGIGPALAEDPVIRVPDADPVMNAAIDKARNTLPAFWTRFASPAPDEHDFNLKLAITDANGTEHFWCVDIEGDAVAATCEIGNEPQLVESGSYGERVSVDFDIISDWMYFDGDKVRGGRTIRAMLSRMSAEDAAYYRSLLLDE